MADPKQFYPRIEPIEGDWLAYSTRHLPEDTEEQKMLKMEILLLLEAGIAAVNLTHRERKYGLRQKFMDEAAKAFVAHTVTATNAGARIEANKGYYSKKS